MGAYSAATTDESEERAPSKHVQVACTLARAARVSMIAGWAYQIRYTDISSRFARFVVSRYDMPMRKWLHAFLETVAYGFFTCVIVFPIGLHLSVLRALASGACLNIVWLMEGMLLSSHHTPCQLSTLAISPATTPLPSRSRWSSAQRPMSRAKFGSVPES